MMDVITWPELGVLMTGLGAMATAGGTAWRVRSADKRYYDKELSVISKDLADFKLHVATMHPTMKELAAIEERLILALNRMSDRLDRLLERDIK